jgi:DinB superfamily
MAKPSPSSYLGYFKRYIDLVEEEDLLTAFKKQAAGWEQFFNSISEEKSSYAYAANKWTIKELLQHAIDTERILAYRALCLARGEQQNLPGFEEDEYAANSFAHHRKWSDLTAEFLTVRKSTELLFESFSDTVLNNAGRANDNPVTVLSLGFTIVGHWYHHQKVLAERYL